MVVIGFWDVVVSTRHARKISSLGDWVVMVMRMSIAL